VVNELAGLTQRRVDIIHSKNGEKQDLFENRSHSFQETITPASFCLIVIGKNRGYCFEARTWDLCFPPESRFELAKVFRQDDLHFIKILNQARVGLLSGPSIATLSQCRRDLPSHDGSFSNSISPLLFFFSCFIMLLLMVGIEPTQLYSRNKGVRYINQSRLEGLRTQSKTFHALDRIVVDGWNETLAGCTFFIASNFCSIANLLSLITNFLICSQREAVRRGNHAGQCSIFGLRRG
jgi:hypothetical protein